MTNHEIKVQKLLKANRKQYKTFQMRASNARLIVTADDFGLEVIADALGVTL